MALRNHLSIITHIVIIGEGDDMKSNDMNMAALVLVVGLFSGCTTDADAGRDTTKSELLFDYVTRMMSFEVTV